MSKKLSEMSLDELWQLFPIVLKEHDPRWQEWFIEEKTALERLLPKTCRISHIGSTAVPDIWAKPIIDILLEISGECDMTETARLLTAAGWICMSKSGSRMSFNKGYTENGFAQKVFHLHLRVSGDNDEIYFRDYLLSHREAAIEYEQLKLHLWREFEHNRDGYTDAKTDFVKKYTLKAKSGGK